MSERNAAVSVFNSHAEAEDAVKELQKSGFDMKKPPWARTITLTSMWWAITIWVTASNTGESLGPSGVEASRLPHVRLILVCFTLLWM